MPPTVRSFSARDRLRSTGPTVIRPRSCWSRSFDPDPDAVAEQLRPGFLAEHAIRRLAEPVESVGDLWRPGPADALGQADHPLGVGRPPTVSYELAGVAKAPARADLVQMPIFWPAR